ncbi:MAG: 8-amino-7-oxononanoate synthase [Desulfobacteraceae bacterium]|nr:8-amino-7-oxononanoate synthase [Desulfobacteraceae bacterium]
MNYINDTPQASLCFTNLFSYLKDKSLFRTLKHITKRQGKYIWLDHKKYLNLSSNDYLGLATQESLIQKFYGGLNNDNCVDQFGLGSSSSRLLTGNFNLYTQLEQALCNAHDAQAALVLNSGYHANIGLIPALAGKPDLIISDSLNHASIVDGIRLSRARCIIFEHNDMEALNKILRDNTNKYQSILIVTESVFSMDGDLADIKTLVELKKKHKALLYVDEAHSIGVFGSTGLGLCHQLDLADQIDVLLVPMGKALASHGAYIITDNGIKDVLINKMRPLLYSTALPPVAMNWNLFITTRMGQFTEKRKQLDTTARWFRYQLKKLGIKHTGESHIIPIITKKNNRAVQLSKLLQEKGFLVFPIRPPTVPKNQSRIRISLTSDITPEDIAALPDLIKSVLQNQTL